MIKFPLNHNKHRPALVLNSAHFNLRIGQLRTRSPLLCSHRALPGSRARKAKSFRDDQKNGEFMGISWWFLWEKMVILWEKNVVISMVKNLQPTWWWVTQDSWWFFLLIFSCDSLGFHGDLLGISMVICCPLGRQRWQLEPLRRPFSLGNPHKWWLNFG